jgi:NADPH2:quinone reductase
MVHAIRVHQTGGPEVLTWDSVDVGDPGPGQVRLKQHAIGVNYIDTYQRSGLYKLPRRSFRATRARARSWLSDRA